MRLTLRAVPFCVLGIGTDGGTAGWPALCRDGRAHLTTLTTFAGLTPIIFETSRQAYTLVPMAISLGAGIVFATAIILVLVPCLYLAQEDAERWITPPGHPLGGRRLVAGRALRVGGAALEAARLPAWVRSRHGDPPASTCEPRVADASSPR